MQRREQLVSSRWDAEAIHNDEPLDFALSLIESVDWHDYRLDMFGTLK
jgi:hypothetical protein